MSLLTHRLLGDIPGKGRAFVMLISFASDNSCNSIGTYMSSASILFPKLMIQSIMFVIFNLSFVLNANKYKSASPCWRKYKSQSFVCCYLCLVLVACYK